MLVVTADPAAFDRAAPVLRREAVDVDRMVTADSALELTKAVRFDLIVAVDPVSGMSLERFIAALRSSGSESVRASVVVFTSEDRFDEYRPLLGHGVNRLLGTARMEGQLQEVVSELLHVADRATCRTMLRVDLGIEDSNGNLVLCQTENLSATGVLVRGPQLSIGSVFEFELVFKEQPKPLRGRARVVRHTNPKEPVKGFGAQFLSFEGEGRERLVEYLSARLDDASSSTS